MPTSHSVELSDDLPKQSIPDTDRRSWYLGGFRSVVLPKIYIIDETVRKRAMQGPELSAGESDKTQWWESMGFFANDSGAIQYQIRSEQNDPGFKGMKGFADPNVNDTYDLVKEFGGDLQAQLNKLINGYNVNRFFGKDVDEKGNPTGNVDIDRDFKKSRNLAGKSDKEGKLIGSSNLTLKDNAIINEQDTILRVTADTSLGGNDAINPYWSYNEDDDIVHPQTAWNRSLADQKGFNLEGLGRVYAENIDRYQQILWINMGIPQYKGSITSLFGGSATQARLVNRGNTLVGTIGNLFGTIFSFVLIFPLLPLYGIFALMDLFNVYPVTRYFEHRTAMPLYYKFVNVLIGHMAVNLGLYRSIDTLFGALKEGFDAKKQDNANTTTGDKAYKQSLAGVPQILKQGPDILEIMYRRVKRMRAYNAKLQNNKNLDGIFKTTEEYMKAYIEATEAQKEEEVKKWIAHRSANTKLAEQAKKAGNKADVDKYHKEIKIANDKLNLIEQAKNDESILSKIGRWFGFKGEGFCDRLFGMMGGTGLMNIDFIGFKIEKTTSVSESISNSTGPSDLANQVNGAAQQGLQKQHSFLGMALSGRTGIWGVDDLMQGVGSFLAGVTDTLGLGNAVNIITGNGFADIPEQWQSSSFSRSYSVELQLRTRYGDAVSWLQSVGIPLACILAAGLPRGVGTAMYTSPFLVRCYCKGMFSIPTGIIESISMTRGGSEFGWSINRLPLAIDVNITFKDLSPILYVGMDNDMNTSLDEYMSTLTGLGLYERTQWFPRILRRINRSLLLKRNTWFSPLYWGNLAGNTGIVKTGAALMSVFGGGRALNNN